MEYSESFINGWFTHKNKKKTEQNPYNEDTQVKSHTEWMLGWSARFNAIKHQGSLALDEHELF